MNAQPINPTATLATAASILNALETVKGIAAVLEQQAAEAAAREEEERQKQEEDRRHRAHAKKIVYQNDLIAKTYQFKRTKEDGTEEIYAYHIEFTDGDMFARFSSPKPFTNLTMKEFSCCVTSDKRSYYLDKSASSETKLCFDSFGRRNRAAQRLDEFYIVEFLERCMKAPIVFSNKKIAYLVSEGNKEGNYGN